MKNPILDELRKTREKLLAESGGTLSGLVRRLQAKEKASEREFVTPPPDNGPNTRLREKDRE
jgi:hypothetical protein